MKRIAMFLIALAALAGTAWAQETAEVRDNLGRKYLVDVKTLNTPGAGGEIGSLEGAIISEPDTLPWQGHMFDLAFELSAVGVAGDDSSTTESALTSLGLLWIPSNQSGWFAVGPRVTWNMNAGDEVTFDIPMRFTVAPDPYSAYRWNVHFSAFTYTVHTTGVDTPRSSAFSFIPTLSFGWEIPRGSYSVEFAAGAGYPFSLEGVTDEEVNSAVKEAQIGGRVTVYWRQR